MGKSEGELRKVGRAHGGLDFVAVWVGKRKRCLKVGNAFSAELLVGWNFPIVHVVPGGFTGRFVQEHHREHILINILIIRN